MENTVIDHLFIRLFTSTMFAVIFDTTTAQLELTGYLEKYILTYLSSALYKVDNAPGGRGCFKTTRPNSSVSAFVPSLRTT